jgi:hypothetical protein
MQGSGTQQTPSIEAESLWNQFKIVLPHNHNDSDAKGRNKLAAGGSSDE